MPELNRQYFDVISSLQMADNASTVEKSIKNLLQLRQYILTNYPEYLDSITDVDYNLACAAFRINNVELFERVVQRHYYDDSRFKRLYQIFLDVETTNAWKHIVQSNATNLEKTFVRSLSIIILTGVCISLVLRK